MGVLHCAPINNRLKHNNQRDCGVFLLQTKFCLGFVLKVLSICSVDHQILVSYIIPQTELKYSLIRILSHLETSIERTMSI